MATNGEDRAPQIPALTALPRIEELPRVENGYDPERVQDAFEAFRRHAAQIQGSSESSRPRGATPPSSRPATRSGWTRCT